MVAGRQPARVPGRDGLRAPVGIVQRGRFGLPARLAGMSIRAPGYTWSPDGRRWSSPSTLGMEITPDAERRMWSVDVATGEQTEVQTPVAAWQRLAPIRVEKSEHAEPGHSCPASAFTRARAAGGLRSEPGHRLLVVRRREARRSDGGSRSRGTARVARRPPRASRPAGPPRLGAAVALEDRAVDPLAPRPPSRG